MKKLFLVLLTLWIPVIASGQNVELVKSFTDGNPFYFGTKWDLNEGTRPGISQIYFIDHNTILAIEGYSQDILRLNTSWEVLGRFGSGWGSRDLSIGSMFVTYIAAESIGTIFVYDKNNLLINPIVIQGYGLPAYGYGTIANNFLFSPTFNSNIFGARSWEINLQKRSFVYRDPEATKRLLQEGLAEQLGIKVDHNWAVPRQYNAPLKVPIRDSSELENYQYDKDQYKSFNLRPLFEQEMIFCGTDAKGLYYFWTVSPTLFEKSVTKSKDGDWDNDPYNATYVNPDKQLVFGIADPWQKKLIFRVLPKGLWNPPADRSRGVLGAYPQFIHPDGHIYFFDGDEKTKTFTLRRVVNDWWSELGFDKKEVGIVNDNRVRVRKTDSTNGEIVGHVYELEHALILEKGTKEETIGGQTAPWLRIQTSSGLVGWVFGAFVDIQK